MMRQHRHVNPAGTRAQAASHYAFLALLLAMVWASATPGTGQAAQPPTHLPAGSAVAPAGPEDAPASQARPGTQGTEPKAPASADAATEDAQTPFSARAVTPSMEFEKAPGVLGFSIRSKRLEGLRAYATEPLGLTALGLEDVGLASVNKQSRIEVNLGERIRFEAKGNRIPPSANRMLDGIGRVLAENPETRIEIRAHTDDQGDSSYNQALSQRRADAIRAYLIGRGVIPERISGVGLGESSPLTPTAKGRSPSRTDRVKNRRIELIIEPREVPETETLAVPDAEPETDPESDPDLDPAATALPDSTTDAGPAAPSRP